MSNRKVYFLINGILTLPGNVNAWTDNAEAWIEGNTPYKATRMEYACGVLTRRFRQNDRVNDLELVCKKYEKERLVLVAHSNGCDMVLRLLMKRSLIFDHIHLIAGACESDFKKNGLNDALQLDQVKKLSIYWSPNDSALKKARLSSILLSWIGLGYGYLGLTGAKNLNQSQSHKVNSIEKAWDHSDWFKPENFENTMKLVVGATV